MAGARGQYEGYFAKFQLLSKVQTLSHKHLVRQTLTTTIAIGTPKTLLARIFK